MFGSGIEGFIVKWTLGIVFAGVVILFVGKIGALFLMAGKLKFAAFLKAHPWIEAIGQAVAK